MNAAEYDVRINSALRGRAGPRWHWNSPVLTDYDLWIPTYGKGTISDGNRSWKASRGFCYLLRKGNTYEAHQDRDSHLQTVGVHFDFLDANGSVIRPNVDLPFQIELTNADFAIELAERTVDAWRADVPERRNLRALELWGRACVTEILSNVSMELPGGLTRGQRIQLEHVMRYEINRWVSPKFSIEQLAERMGCSRRHFARLFKLHNGVSPSEYILKRRIDIAKHLLSTTTRTSTAIAAELGFSDASHFTKQFRKYTGRTPAEYRRRSQD